jgi:hypothetical protein
MKTHLYPNSFTAMLQGQNFENNQILVHGVFGSGKSYLLVILIMFLVKIFEESGAGPSMRILVSAVTNIAGMVLLLLCILKSHNDLIFDFNILSNNSGQNFIGTGGGRIHNFYPSWKLKENCKTNITLHVAWLQAYVGYVWS